MTKRRRSTVQLGELLVRYSAANHSLDHVSKLVGRKPSTIRRHARAQGLSFADYKPRGKNNV